MSVIDFDIDVDDEAWSVITPYKRTVTHDDGPYCCWQCKAEGSDDKPACKHCAKFPSARIKTCRRCCGKPAS